MHNSEKKLNSLTKSERSIGILSKVGKSSVVPRNSSYTTQKIDSKSLRNQDALLQEVTPRRNNNVSLLEHQLSQPCSEFNFQPIALFEKAPFEKTRPNYISGAGKVQTEENSLNVENKDHNYSAIKMSYSLRSDSKSGLPKTPQYHYGSPSSSQVDKSFTQITNINDLKKITPRVKVLNQDTPTLQPIKKMNPILKNPSQGSTAAIPDESVRNQLRKYCRTCAGVKYPLVDIFSEKGVQMKLHQQIKHLEKIYKADFLSTQMCMDCICDLKMSYTFFVQIKKAEIKLRSIQSKLLEQWNESHANTRMSAGSSKSPNLPLIKHDPVNLKNNGPRIAAVFSAQSVDWESELGFSNLDTTSSNPGTTKAVSATPKIDSKMDGATNDLRVKVKSEPKADTKNESENESIEEFDPDDPPFNPDSEEDMDSDGEPKKVVNPFKKTLQKLEVKSFANEKPLVEEKAKSSMKEVGTGSGKESDLINLEQKLSPANVKNVAKVDIMEGKEKVIQLQKEAESPSLKRKLQESSKTKPMDGKIRKFNVNDALSIKTEENGVMYVTVRGEKPNELLLVKVKKMDKGEKGKPAKKAEFLDRSLEQKSQIIESQIENYKRKREQFLGPKGIPSVNDLISELKIKQENDPLIFEARHVPDKAETPMLKLKDISEMKKEKVSEKSPKSSVSQRFKDKKNPVEVKVYNNAEDYNTRLEAVTMKWEDKQRKDLEGSNSVSELPLERLRRVLGELCKGENLNEFIDNLQQRKMILSRLNDEDLITLFKERIATKVHHKEEAIELQPVREEDLSLVDVETSDCDFCFHEFPSKEVRDEHMKFHDTKFQYFCEDCSEEFQNLRLKKNHNVICIKKLICKYCDLMLDSKGKKKQHEQKHCDSLFGQLCEFCGEKFKHQGTLDQHVKTKHSSLEKNFQCPKCPKKFAFKTKLSFHLKSVHTALRAYLCEDCGADFKNPASLRHHRIRKHLPIGNKRECPVCRKMIPFYSLSKHMHTHKAYTIKCPHCDKMFKNSSTLKQHVRIHEDQRQFRCDTCGVGFNRRDGLRLHMKVHQKTDSRGLKECSCQVCGEKFPNHSMLVIHRNRVHKDGRNYTCHICNRSMISTRSLEWHLAHIHNEPLPGVVKSETMISSGSDSKRVSCFHCHKTFKTEMILRTHIKNSHMEKEPVKCLDCDETFLSEVRLRHHMMVTHNRLEGTLPCPHCPKRFVNQLRLKTHMIAHSEERPFKCDICGFNLKTKIQLIKHHQNRHSDERPLQCRYCPWRCKQVSALVCHERTHTNERPYSCSVCRQRFKYLGDKNKHERRHESLGGSGFKRIVTNRGPKKIKTKKEEEFDTSNSEQEQLEEQLEEQFEEQIEEQMEEQMEEDEMETMDMEARLVDVAYEVEENIKGEANVSVIEEDSEYANYEQEYEESSKDATEVIMSMEDTAVYTEEVTAENIETTHIIEDEIMANQILQSGTVVHIEQHDEEGKIQVIPVVLSLPDLTEESAEVNLATTSIMYNNEEE